MIINREHKSTRNKRTRQHKKKHLYQKRLKRLQITKEQEENPVNNFHALRTTGTPCSCEMCSGEKYNREIKHKQNYQLIDSDDEN